MAAVTLTPAQLRECVDQMIVHCELKMPQYEMVCARSVLIELGYSAHIDQVLEAIAKAGFEYCLDSSIECNSGLPEGGKRARPSQDVCWWGPDQLKSRLHAIAWSLDRL